MTSNPAIGAAAAHSEAMDHAEQEAPKQGAFSALRERNFALLWWSGVGQAASLGMQQIALGHFVFDRTHSEFWTGMVVFMGFIPFFTFSLFAGAIGDRMNRRTLLIGAHLWSGAFILLLALLIITDVVQVWMVMAIAFAAAFSQSVTVPIRFALVGELVQQRVLMNAIALNSLSQNGMRIVGPVLAGVLIASAGHGWTILVISLGYLLGVLPLLRLQTPPRDRAYIASGSVFANIAEGINFARRTPVVMYALLLSNFGFSLFGMPYLSMLPVFAKEVLGKGATELGYLSAAGGAGSVLGALLLARLGDYPHKRRLFQGFYVLFFTALVAFSLSPVYALSLVMLVFVGMGSMTHINVGTALVQLNTPRELQGRVMSLWTWGICLNMLGAMPVGALSEIWGAPPVMAGWALCGLLFGLMLMGQFRRVPMMTAASPAG